MEGDEGPLAIGIDIGSTKIVLAVCKKQSAEIVLDPEENRSTPFCVAFTNQQRLMSNTAKYQNNSNPENTIFGRDIKQLMGLYLTSQEPDLIESPVQVHRDQNGFVQFGVQYKKQTECILPEHAIAMILTKLIENIQEKYGKKNIHAVVTVPCMFTSAQRFAVRNACTAAEVHVEAILNDSTASAITYNIEVNNSDDKTVLIFDMGASCLSVGAFKLRGNKIQALAHYGDLNLGGKSFDNVLYEYFIKEFHEKTGVDLNGNFQAISRLYEACEKVKKILSTASEASLFIETFYEGKPYQLKITRNVFENICAPLFDRINSALNKVIFDAELSFGTIDEFIVVGNGWRIPKIEQLLIGLFNSRDLSKVINQDESVAKGAAYLAGRKVLKSNVAYRIQRLSISEVNVLPVCMNFHTGDFTMIRRCGSLPKAYEMLYEPAWISPALYFKQGHQVFLEQIYDTHTKLIDVRVDINIDGLLRLEIVPGTLNEKTDKDILNHQDYHVGLINQIFELEQKFKHDEEEYKRMTKMLNDLEASCLSYKRTIQSKELKENLSGRQLDIVIKFCQDTLTWLDDNKENTDINHLKQIQSELDETCISIIENGKNKAKIKSLKEKVKQLMETEKYKHAIETLSELIQTLTEQNCDHDEIQKWYYYRGVAFYELKHYMESEKDISEVLSSSYNLDRSHTIEAYRIRARCYFNMKNYEKCIQDADKVLAEKTCSEISVIRDESEMLIMEMIVKATIEECRKSLRSENLDDLIQNNHPLITKAKFADLAVLAYMTRAEIRYKLKEHVGAIEDCTEVIKREVDNYKAWLVRGKCYVELKDLDKGLDDFLSLMDLNPPNKFKNGMKEPMNIICKEQIFSVHKFLKDQKYEEAISLLRCIKRTFPVPDSDNQVAMATLFGELHVGLKQYKEAVLSLDEALKINPKWSIALQFRAKAHFELEEWDRTIADCETLKKIDYSYFIIHKLSPLLEKAKNNKKSNKDGFLTRTLNATKNLILGSNKDIIPEKNSVEFKVKELEKNINSTSAYISEDDSDEDVKMEVDPVPVETVRIENKASIQQKMEKEIENFEKKSKKSKSSLQNIAAIEEPITSTSFNNGPENKNKTGTKDKKESALPTQNQNLKDNNEDATKPLSFAEMTKKNVSTEPDWAEKFSGSKPSVLPSIKGKKNAAISKSNQNRKK